jgi:hypothetical protein
MNGWRGDDVTAIATQIDTLRQPGTIPGKTTGVSKVEVTPAAAGYDLHRRRERPVSAF